MTPTPRQRQVLLTILLFTGSAARLSAGLVFSNELFTTGAGSILDTTYQPLDPSAPAIHSLYLITDHGYFTYDLADATLSNLSKVPRLNPLSIAAVSQRGSGDQILFLNVLNQLVTWDTTSMVSVPPSPFVNFVFQTFSMADSLTGTTTILADGNLYVVDTKTGGGTNELATTAHYQSWGPNGLLYLLTPLPGGQLVIQALDPSQNYAVVLQFPVLADTANMQFTVGSNGDIYVQDGVGGGSYYDSQGDLLGTFDIPGGQGLVVGPNAYLATDSSNDVVLFGENPDLGTEIFEYTNTPEPSVFLLSGAGLSALLIRKRRMLAHSDDVDQSFRSDVDQNGAKRRRALSV